MLLYSDLITAPVSEAVADPLRSRIIYDDNVNSIPWGCSILFQFLHGTGGISCQAWVQTSLDRGSTWIDIASAKFLKISGSKLFTLTGETPITSVYTPTDGLLAEDTCINGILGSLYRVKITTKGNYSANTRLSVFGEFRW